MTITEEQNIANEHKAEDAGNTQSPTISTSAKKVYSKPTLVVLSQNQGTAGKNTDYYLEYFTTTGPS